MSPGRPGRVKYLAKILDEAPAAMTIAEIVKEWDRRGYQLSTAAAIGQSLANAAVNPSTGVRRIKSGLYTHVSKLPDPSARALEIAQERQKRRDVAPHTPNPPVVTSRGTFDILHTLPDGRILLRENWDGQVWIAKEV